MKTPGPNITQVRKSLGWVPNEPTYYLPTDTVYGEFLKNVPYNIACDLTPKGIERIIQWKADNKK